MKDLEESRDLHMYQNTTIIQLVVYNIIESKLHVALQVIFFMSSFNPLV